MLGKEYLQKFITLFCLMASGYAAAAGDSTVTAELTIAEEVKIPPLGRATPAYFKILTFDQGRWSAFTDTFPDHPLAKAIKENLASIELSSLILTWEDIYASEFFKQKMREKYDASFRGERTFAPFMRAVDTDGMYAGIINILETTNGDIVGFQAAVEELREMSQRVVTAYNHRVSTSGGNTALLKHFLSKIFFNEKAYSDSILMAMRLVLLTEGLVAGDDYLFADEPDPSHTLTKSLLKRFVLEGNSDTLVLGCGHSLVSDVEGTPSYYADDFVQFFTKKQFIQDCQHCQCDHDHQVAIAIYEPGSNFGYSGSAHADIIADALAPSFWHALAELRKEGRSPIRCIIDHGFFHLDSEKALTGRALCGEALASSLDVGGTFRTYLDDFAGKIEPCGFALQGTERFGERTEYIYVKVR